MFFLKDIRRWRENRRNIAFLHSLSERELSDIGVSRSEISRRVRGK